MVKKKINKSKKVSFSKVNHSKSNSLFKSFPKKKKIIETINSKLISRNLIFFSVLALLSFLLSVVTENQFYDSIFILSGIIFLFLALAFLIVFIAVSFAKGKK